MVVVVEKEEGKDKEYKRIIVTKEGVIIMIVEVVLVE